MLREVGDKTPDIKQAIHTYFVAKKSEKSEIAADAVKAMWPAIIFCRTRHGSDRLVKQLKRFDIAAESIHGGKSQNQRQRALKNFSKGKVQALVATDVAARGIHVDGVELVVHFDLPEDHKAYIHRSGRTARAGNKGIVFSIIQPDQKRAAQKMQARLGISDSIRKIQPEELATLSSAPSSRNHQGSRPKQQSPKDSGQRKKTAHKKSSNNHGNQKAKKRSQTMNQKPKGKNSSHKNRNSNKNKSHKSQSGGNKRKPEVKPTGRPNRKARRAHLQPTKR